MAKKSVADTTNSPAWFINALTALIVSVVAGLVVWWLTNPGRPNNKLVYQIEKTGEFASSPQGKYFYKVYIRNDGMQIASGTAINISSVGQATLADWSVTHSLTKPSINNIRVSGGSLQAQIPNLRPREQVNFYLAFKSPKDPKVNLTATSNQGIVDKIPEVKKGLLSNPFILFLLLISFSLVTFLVYKIVIRVSKTKSRIEGLEYNPGSPNNAAFIFIHANRPEEAQIILRSAMSSGDASPVEISNYATTVAQKGDIVAADKIIESIDPWASDPHDAAVVDFNKLIINKIAGRNFDTESLLKKYPADEYLKKYVSRSSLLK